MRLKYKKKLLDISNFAFIPQDEYIQKILPEIQYDFRFTSRVQKRAKTYIHNILKDNNFGVEQFLQKYSLSTEEGVAILCLAESLVRVPDQVTAMYLVVDKLSKKNWSQYISFAKSRIVELSTLGLFALGKIVDKTAANNALTRIFRRITDPIILDTIKHAIKFLGKEFIIGYEIESALKRAKSRPEYLYSFDLLGESSRTEAQATEYYKAYLEAMKKMEVYFPSNGTNLYERPNLSIKLSSLFPRVEALKLEEIQEKLLPKLLEILSIAQNKSFTITFDAEECKRQDIYLEVLTQLITHKQFKDYSGIGDVVQAYQKRAANIINYIVELAKKTNKQIPIRLVKGAYWDSEIKYAQENGFIDFPVFTKKEYVDGNYLFCAKIMYLNAQYIYSQFATHNALTSSYIMELFEEKTYEMQKLFGMGNCLHGLIVKEKPVRIYAPIGKMEDLLAYLMRRLLENGASSSFVNKLNSKDLDIKKIILPIDEQIKAALDKKCNIRLPIHIYEDRNNSLGIDLGYIMNLEKLQNELLKYENKVYVAGPIIEGKEVIASKHYEDTFLPGNTSEKIGEVSYAKASELKYALNKADEFCADWAKISVNQRSLYIKKMATMLEENKFELYSLLIREAGKSIQDAIGEVREAIDFCNYYSLQSEKIIVDRLLPGVTGEQNTSSWHPRGVFLCISPWNFPLAIFLGQIVAALVAGNCVLCKPAAQTSLIANFVIKLFYNTGIPKNAIQLLLAKGSLIGEVILSDDRIKGVAFTGSIEIAKFINLAIAQREGAIVPLIAETGGQNVMIVDSSAVLEQATDDIISSAFYSAGQRCSALRVLYIQEEITIH